MIKRGATMKAKHTPGPWVIHLAQTVCIRPASSDTLIARLFGARSKAETNARLIAAAPDLLEACKRALPYLQDHIALTRHEGPGNRIALDLCEEAIRKAEGQ